jgi:predicted acyltransferase
MQISPVESSPGRTARLVSLDVLRGFAMIWILGLDELAHQAYTVNNSPLVRFFHIQLEHVEWAGFHFYDLIFSLFVFISGVSLVFSVNKRLRTGSRAFAVRHVIIRGGVLYLLGVLFYGGFSKTIGDIRLMGVLQRIAICGLIAGLLYIFTSRRTLIITTILLLVGYWALMTFVPVPGTGETGYRQQMNLAIYVDMHYLPWFKWFGNWDPEGLLSTIPAVATCLIGVLAGQYLAGSRQSHIRTSAWLAAAGLGALAAGLLWSLQFPIIKNLWTSSFVLVTAGFSLLLLAVFYELIDGQCLRGWAMPLAWIGANAILLYLLKQFIDWNYLARVAAGIPIKNWFGRSGDVALTALSVILLWLLAYWLYQRKIFVKI